MKHFIIIALAFPLLAFGQVGSINVPLTLDTNGVPVSHPGFFDTNAAAIASAAAPVISLDAGRITSGVLSISRIATGTPTGTKFVRDDGTLATPAGGGGGSNFITSVSADFQVLLEALSLTNATGTGQLLRASTLSPYLLSATASTLYQSLDPNLSDLADGSLTGSKVGPGVDAGNITTGTLGDARIPTTIARLDSPQFTGTVGFEFLQADTVQVPWASRYAAANSSSNLVATSDGQSWTNLNGSSIATGTVADARIDAALARLASPTFTGDPKAPTASPGDNDTSIASTAFVTAAVAAGGGSGGTGTVVTASGGSDMSRANITTNGFGLLVTQSGTNILLSTTNNYPVDYYAGGFLPLFAGVSNALTGDLSMDQSSDVRLFMSETSRMLTDGYEVMGLRAYNGKLALHSFATNDLSAAEEFMVIDPSDLVGPTDIITFPNSGFNNKVVFEADVELDGNVLATTTSAGASNTVVATTAYVDRAVASGSGGTWDGTPIAGGTITNLTTSAINSRSYYTTENGDFWADGAHTSANANAFPPLHSAAIASGTLATPAGTTNNPFVARFVSSTTTNSGWYVGSLGATGAYIINGGGDEFTAILSIYATNQVNANWGFIDGFTHTDVTDGAYFRLENGFIQGVLANAGSYTRTATSNQAAIASTSFRRYVIKTSADATSVTFWDLSASGTGYVTNWTDSITNTLPPGATGIGVVAVNRATPSAIDMISLDGVGKRITRYLVR